jgi:hypothetical protein
MEKEKAPGILTMSAGLLLQRAIPKTSLLDYAKERTPRRRKARLVSRKDVWIACDLMP